MQAGEVSLMDKVSSKIRIGTTPTHDLKLVVVVSALKTEVH